jgi:hypothetical protein
LAVTDEASRPLAALDGRSVTFAYTRYDPPCASQPGSPVVVFASTVATVGAVLSTSTLPAEAPPVPSLSLAVTEYA